MRGKETERGRQTDAKREKGISQSRLSLSNKPIYLYKQTKTNPGAPIRDAGVPRGSVTTRPNAHPQCKCKQLHVVSATILDSAGQGRGPMKGPIHVWVLAAGANFGGLCWGGMEHSGGAPGSCKEPVYSTTMCCTLGVQRCTQPCSPRTHHLERETDSYRCE